MKNPDKLKELLRSIAIIYPTYCLPYAIQEATAKAAKDALTYIERLEKRLAYAERERDHVWPVCVVWALLKENSK